MDYLLTYLAPIVNGRREIVEKGCISHFEGLLTLTLDRVILHTVVHHSSTCTYLSNYIEIEETFCERTDVRTNEHLRLTLLG